MYNLDSSLDIQIHVLYLFCSKALPVFLKVSFHGQDF